MMGVFKKEIPEQFDKHLIAVWKPESIAAEQYRVLRRHIVEKFAKNGSRIFLITSAVHGEGKTFTSINLALAIAKGMYGTALLIDADLRKPNISNMCGFKKDTKGLTEYLINGNNLEQFIMKTPIPEFYIIPSGKPPDNPAELISSEKMINLIREIKNRYHHFYIILDSPPLIPVVDSTILASLADSVIIVIKASSTPKELIEESINKIEDKKKIQGLILNECDSHVFKYYDTYYKYYKENE